MGCFLIFGRFGRTIFGDEFWPYIAPRKSFGVISIIFEDIFNSIQQLLNFLLSIFTDFEKKSGNI